MKVITTLGMTAIAERVSRNTEKARAFARARAARRATVDESASKTGVRHVPVRWLVAALAIAVELGAFLAWQRWPRHAAVSAAPA